MVEHYECMKREREKSCVELKHKGPSGQRESPRLRNGVLLVEKGQAEECCVPLNTFIATKRGRCQALDFSATLNKFPHKKWNRARRAYDQTQSSAFRAPLHRPHTRARTHTIGDNSCIYTTTPQFIHKTGLNLSLLPLPPTATVIDVVKRQWRLMCEFQQAASWNKHSA